MPQMRSQHQRSGFTFIELMIVAVVAAILVISTMPDSRATERRTAFEFMQRFEADIAFAQSMSIARPDDPLVIRVDASADVYWLARASAPDTPIKHPRTGRSYIVAAGDSETSDYQGVDIVGAISGDSDSMAFNSTGGIDADASSYLLVSSGNTDLQLEVANATGKTEITNGFSISMTDIRTESSKTEESNSGDLGDTVDDLIKGIGDTGDSLLGR